MATPVKAFTDPTGLSALLRGPTRPGSAGIALALITPNPPAPKAFAPASAIPALAMAKQITMANPTTPKVPDPPFGRSIVITFPVIYRERPRDPEPPIPLPPPPLPNPNAWAGGTSNRFRLTYTTEGGLQAPEALFPIADIDYRPEPPQ